MPKPHIFQSRDDLIQSLRATSTQELAESFFAQRTATVTCVTQEGVGGNTFRAFRNLPVRPSVAFRTWTAVQVEQSLPQLLQSCSASQTYANYVHDLTLALNQYWLQHAQSEMGYGRGAKLLNLVLKKLACYARLSDQQRSSLIQLLHVPLDSYTIVGLHRVAPQFRIPKNATMKFITTPAQYNQFQAFIASVTRDAGVPPIYYDILAWDRAH